ncbi:hypothetical protein [Gulosibacter sp. 10]|uniref:hypothetical protein n=1 Tax=Gulosibacter sp. 10 TaxID=1255570 RepID=UPI00097EE6BE|nr:hypothetical protein [Gulosibacter sp. 10]SJM51393.1 hypothetical protein FM112_01945 [Gulosibacter sp. 10]
MTTVLLPRTEDLAFERFGFMFRRLTETRWRIVQRTGAVVGYLEHETDDRWSISRMTADRRHFVVLGTFSTFEEALTALRRM